MRNIEQMRRHFPNGVYIVKGFTSGDQDIHPGVPAGTDEWQFSDGPAGARGYSEDFLTIEEGLREFSGMVIHFNAEDVD